MLKQYPPGSLRVKYTGFRGLIINQISSQFRSLHKDWAEEYFAGDRKAFWENARELSLRRHDIKNGGAWFERQWFHSLLEEKGGAPKVPILVIRGPVHNIINAGFAFISPSFQFKFKEFKLNILDTKLYKWNVRFKPEVKFSGTNILRRLRANVVFECLKGRERLIEVRMYSGYKLVDNSGNFGFLVILLQW